MEVVIPVLVSVAGIVAVVFAAASFASRGARNQARSQVRTSRATRWSVATLSTVSERRGSLTMVVVRRQTEEGKVLDESVVAEIPDGTEDWAAQVGQARAEAASRAAVLNTEP